MTRFEHFPTDSAEANLLGLKVDAPYILQIVVLFACNQLRFLSTLYLSSVLRKTGSLKISRAWALSFVLKIQWSQEQNYLKNCRTAKAIQSTIDRY